MLLILLQILILLPPVQEKLRTIAISTLEDQVDAHADIGKIGIAFPKTVQVHDLLISKSPSDTILYQGKLTVNIRLLPLLKHKIVVKRLELKDGYAEVGRLLDLVPADTLATEQDTVPGEDPSSWDFEIHKLVIQACYYTYRDDRDVGFELILDFGKAILNVGQGDLEKRIFFAKVETDQTYVSYESLELSGSGMAEDISATSFADIAVGQVHLANSEFRYIDSTGALIFTAGGEWVDVDDLLVDINHETVAIDNGVAKNMTCSVLFLPAEEDTADVSEEGLDWGQYLWRVQGNEMALENFRFTLDDQQEPDPPGHFNSSRMDIHDVTGKVNDFTLDEDILTVNVQSLRAKEKNGLEIMHMHGTMAEKDSIFSIHDMVVQTPYAHYSLNLVTGISPTDYTHSGDKQLDLELSVQSKGWRDLDYFYPFLDSLDMLSDAFRDHPFELDVAIHGNTRDLTLESLDFAYLDATRLSAQGSVHGLLSADDLKISLAIEELTVDKKDIDRSVDRPIDLDGISLPGYVTIRGNLDIDNDKQSFAGLIQSGMGEIAVEELHLVSGPVPAYSARITANLHHLDAYVDSGVDRAFFKAEGSFEGSDISMSTGWLRLKIDTLDYNGYSYKDMKLETLLQEGDLIADLRSADPNLDFKIEIEGNLSEIHQEMTVELDIRTIDLHALNLIDQEVSLSTVAGLRASLSNNGPFDANLTVETLDLEYSDTIYRMHPLTLNFATSPERTLFHLKSHFYFLDFMSEGTFQDLVGDLAALPDHYLEDSIGEAPREFLPAFRIDGRLDYPEAFASLFFPGLPAFDDLEISGGYDRFKDDLSMRVFLDGTSFGNIRADSIHIVLQGSSEILDYRSNVWAAVNGLISGQLGISGSFRDRQLINRLKYTDGMSECYLDIRTIVRQSGQDISFSILQDSLTFSYDPWKIDPENRVTLAGDHIIVKNLILENGDQSISIASSPEEDPKDLRLVLESFRLGSLEHLLDMDTVVSGIASADFRFKDVFGDPGILGKLTIDSLGLYDIDAGRLDMPVFELDNQGIYVEVSIDGALHDIGLEARMDPALDRGVVDATLEINRLDLAEFNYLFEEDLSDMTGELQGEVDVSGTLEDPVMNGFLRFRDAVIGVRRVNNTFILGNERIQLSDNVLKFDHFTIENRQKQSARLNGTISLDGTASAYHDLILKTDDIVVMNSDEDDNNWLYGFLKAQAGLEIKGTADNLRLTASVEVDQETDITYSFPDELSLADHSGTVQFVDFDSDTAALEPVHKDATFFSMESIRNINSFLEIDPGAKFKLFFDASGHSFLDASLNGTINYNVKEGVEEISGMLGIEEGNLNYSIPMVTVEEYTIEPGSFITISNDLYNPFLNIIASSSVRASTESLMGNYAKVMTFKVLLYLTGELNDVKLRFDISTETGDALVSAKLAQLTEEERNMNALNLLVRGSFVLSVKGDEIGSTSMTEAQLDKFYAAHLNHLISENIHFVDLHFDVQSFRDYNVSGEKVLRRNYYYNVGKSFFHDRARINYKGSLGVTNDLHSEQLNSQFVQNELEMEIKITESGSLRGVFFRKNQYEGLLEGEVIETGGGLRLQKEFYSVRELFVNELRKGENKVEGLND